ncbi:uncharacterized protein N7469_000194 [Penicillium citrinum]|uniref:Uncharacterized protein n=1 Tax=Penicillium citrinum TaxID=5077 RepID=A0A9W9TUG8_PENCI|nr:uncharacterized protein N7469_000194 [Penicillium citrinum]KAJ5241867.1 hypothetical protein N7469_000194 [Penicillium citrinum]
MKTFKDLLLLTLAISSPAYAAPAPWLITQANQEVPVTVYDYYTTIITTTIEPIIPTVTSLPEALSTVTQVNTIYDVTAVQKLYPSGVGTVADFNEAYYVTDAHKSTVFVVDLTYTAPTGCSSSWTTTTAATLVVNPTVEALLPKTKTKTSYSTNTELAFRPTTYTYESIWVDPTQIPTSSMDLLRDEYRPRSLYTGGGCYYTSTYNEASNYYPTTYTSGSTSDTSDTSNSDYPYHGYYWYNVDDWYEYYYGISLLGIILASVLSWVGFWFLLGILESWVRFRRLMLGWQTRRGLPVCWCLIALPISLFCLFAFKKGFRARNPSDAAILKQRWDKMSAWRKFKLFVIWGFRFQYPDVLGPPPPKVKVSKKPGTEAGPPLLQESPPATGARGDSTEEMGEVVRGEQPVVQPLSRAVVPESEQIGRARSC